MCFRQVPGSKVVASRQDSFRTSSCTPMVSFSLLMDPTTEMAVPTKFELAVMWAANSFESGWKANKSVVVP